MRFPNHFLTMASVMTSTLTSAFAQTAPALATSSRAMVASSASEIVPTSRSDYSSKMVGSKHTTFDPLPTYTSKPPSYSVTALPSSNADVPRNRPIQGDYTGDYRPQVHFSPPKGFMNDPNGCFVDAKGIWHLYYQYNPTELVAGNQHWGHATSPDLYNWTNQPIALFPPAEGDGVFSGSIVIDSNNTSGFFPDQTDGVVAIYTLNRPGSQSQYIAYSTDGGYSFTPYENNPVLDVGAVDFRDPKVIWHEDHWVMVVAYSTDFVISIYTSQDLKHWDHASNFSHHGLLGLLYECPNLVQVPLMENGTATGEMQWVLIISINPGAPQGGSISQYFPGTFDGYTFTPVDGAARISDFAKDNYAEQFFYGTDPKEAVSIAWASNWQYTNELPTASEGWRSIMSLPRRNYLTKVERTGWEMVSLPYDLAPILGDQLSYDQDFVNHSVIVDYTKVESGALYFEANFTFPDDITGSNLTSASTFNMTFSSPAGDQVRTGYIFGGSNAGLAWIDRRKAKGYGEDDPLWTDRFSSAGVNLTRTFSGVIDRSVLEVFVDEGAFSGTSLFFTDELLNKVSISTAGMPKGVRAKIAVWELTSTWQGKQ